jgi:hypothetical protein
VDKEMDDWLKRAGYLPTALRDFHDQKDVFKAIHETTHVEGHAYAKGVDWVSGQCYVIDIFLWWMAQRGYTLQRSRRRIAFRNLHDDVDAARQGRHRRLASLIATQNEARNAE